jgi:mRNA interferase MazF
VIVSNDAANSTAARLGRGVVTAVPVTSSVERVYPFQVLLPEQIRSVATERVGDLLGRLPTTLMTALDDALRLHLVL